MSTAAPRSRAGNRRELRVAVGTLGSQFFLYALNIVLLRRLGSATYGELASLVTCTLIASIPGLALQLWVARHVVRDHALAGGARLPARFGTFTLSLAGLTAVVSGLAMLVVAPVLHTAVLPAVLALVVMAPALSVLASAQGVLQGQDRLIALATLFIAAAVGRLVGGLVGSVVHLSGWAPVVGMGLGTWVAAAAGWAMVGQWPRGPGTGPGWSGVSRIVGAAGSMWVLGNIDIVLARANLDHSSAGLYSAGALVARAVQFAPQFIVVATFAQFADRSISRPVLTRAATRVLGLGAAATVVIAVLGTTVIPLVLGDGYRDLGGIAWGFAVLGTLLAINQLLVSQRVARHDEQAAVAVWVSTVVFAGLCALLPGLGAVRLLLIGCGVNLALTGVLTARISARP